jgi:ABC-type glucose/galactose transport system permease subunit
LVCEKWATTNEWATGLVVKVLFRELEILGLCVSCRKEMGAMFEHTFRQKRTATTGCVYELDDDKTWRVGGICDSAGNALLLVPPKILFLVPPKILAPH